MPSSTYVLMTAAKNEAEYIQRTIESVIAQTQKPLAWVIVSDASTDGTDAIIEKYISKEPFIQLIRKDEKEGLPGFASKVKALKIAYASLAHLSFDFIGNLDADISFGREYYEGILEKFEEDPRLGLAGGVVFDRCANEWKRRSPEKDHYVSGAVQFFRRACFEAVGGYPPLKDGGEDTVVAVKARMAGWKVAMFSEFSVFHHKQSSEARGALADRFREGVMFYTLGSHPLFELGKSVLRMKERPYLLGGTARALGYFTALLKGEDRVVDKEFVRFLRKEERNRLMTKLFSGNGKTIKPKVLSDRGESGSPQ
jgi:biofilm PGA synthesis N-glycosyltransferase PgaC